MVENCCSSSHIQHRQIFDLTDLLDKIWLFGRFEQYRFENRYYYYIFLDEIQDVANFEKLVDGLYATENTDIYITGSNANLLSSELATLLSGRYIEVSLLPFSFSEYLQGRNIDTSNKYLNYEALFIKKVILAGIIS